jgi:hypothetical protein
MATFDKLNAEEKEPFNHFVVRQQNKALVASVNEKNRRIDELARALTDAKREADRAASAVSCIQRHWTQVREEMRPRERGAPADLC